MGRLKATAQTRTPRADQDPALVQQVRDLREENANLRRMNDELYSKLLEIVGKQARIESDLENLRERTKSSKREEEQMRARLSEIEGELREAKERYGD